MIARRRLAGLLAATALMAGCGSSGSLDSSRPAAEATPPPAAEATPPAERDLEFSTEGWLTDFSRHSVPLKELVSGGPPADGIPPIDEPKFIAAEEAGEWLADREPVLAVEVDGQARAYPVQILVWHEIVNDRLGGRAIAVTFCPLCNSSLVFDRDLEGIGVLRFGTTGNLRKSDLVMWDDRTQSWWQQFTGEAIVGKLTGRQLEILPSQTLSFADFKARYPDAQVLSRDTGHERDYGANPYAGYDDPGSKPFLLTEKADDRLPPKERVIAVQSGQQAVVVPFSRLRREPVADIEIDGKPVVVFYKRGVSSALDAIAVELSRDVGTAGTFDPRLDGRRLRFTPTGDGRFRDRATGSLWDITGRAIEGPLHGKQLRPVISDQQFWFALAAFLPDARIAR